MSHHLPDELQCLFSTYLLHPGSSALMRAAFGACPTGKSTGSERTFPGSYGRSPETTGTSWTIWSKRSCSSSLYVSETSYSRPLFSTG